MTYLVIFPNQYTLELPDQTIGAIQQAKAKYASPLWQFRAEKVLKLGGHQWIYPQDVVTARELFALHPHGLTVTAWKLFNRGWAGAMEAYWLDTVSYPHHPRHWGPQVMPLVDEDDNSQQIGWLQLQQVSAIDDNFAVFVQFTLLDLFTPCSLPAEYQ